MNYFNELVLSNGNILTCDKLRLKFVINKNSFHSITDAFYDLSNSKEHYDYNCYENFSSFAYKYNYIFKYNDSTVAIGLCFNGVKYDEMWNCYMEFNPNKSLSNNYAQCLVNIITTYSKGLEIARFDLAIDIPVDRGYVFLQKDKRNYCQHYKLVTSGSKLSSSTEYLGQRDSNGFVKVYNKKLESGLKSDLTRVEITLDSFDFANFQKCLPCVYYLENSDLMKFFSLNQTDRVVVNLLLSVDNPLFYVNAFGRDKKDKFKNLLFCKKELQINECTFYEICRRIRNIYN